MDVMCRVAQVSCKYCTNTTLLAIIVVLYISLLQEIRFIWSNKLLSWSPRPCEMQGKLKIIKFWIKISKSLTKAVTSFSRSMTDAVTSVFPILNPKSCQHWAVTNWPVPEPLPFLNLCWIKPKKTVIFKRVWQIFIFYPSAIISFTMSWSIPSCLTRLAAVELYK